MKFEMKFLTKIMCKKKINFINLFCTSYLGLSFFVLIFISLRLFRDFHYKSDYYFKLLIVFILLVLMINTSQLNNTFDKTKPIKDTSGHVKPKHLLYDLLKQYSSGDKLYLSGDCQVNLYTKYIISAEMKVSA